MKRHAEQGLEWAKEVYRTAHANTEKSETSEALSLGVDPSTAHNYLDTDSPRHLPFGLVQNSLYARELTSALCERLGGCFVPIHGRLNPDASHELCAILKAAGELVKNPDPKEQERLYVVIEEAAAKARLEEKSIVIKSK